MNNEIVQKIMDFFTFVKDSNYDVAIIYAQEPMMVQIIGGVLFVILILIFMVNRSLKRYGKLKILANMDNSKNSFDEYQSYMNKVVKILPSANDEFMKIFETNKDSYYTTQLAKLEDFEIDEKIAKYQEMSQTYRLLGNATSKNQELSAYYETIANDLLDGKLYSEITFYIEDLNFSEETIPHIEAIVAYANILEESESILDQLTNKLQNVDFGANLDIFLFVRSLDSEKLVQIYEYCITKQDELFEDENIKISSDILDYLLENDEKDKVYNYIKTLTLATYLQELNYKYFNQNDNLEFDLIFMANPTEINSKYKEYLESKLTDNWRDDDFIESLIKSENIANIIGHETARLTIERVDSLRKEYDEKEILDEALQTAQDAKAIALEAKELASKNITR